MLNEQVWINQLNKNFYPDTSFLQKTTDFSPYVDGSKLHIPISGEDPEILINVAVGERAVGVRIDTDNEVPVDEYETPNILITDVEAIEVSYTKMETVLSQHRMALQKAIGKRAIFEYGALTDETATPIIGTTGATSGSRKILKAEDIIALKEEMDLMDAPVDNRVLVLHPSHMADLLKQDVGNFKQLSDLKNGVSNRFAGFSIYQFSVMPYYTISTKTKLDWGAVPEAGDAFASVAYCQEQVFKAVGADRVYLLPNDPRTRGTIIGFSKRFCAGAIAQKGLGVIYSAAA